MEKTRKKANNRLLVILIALIVVVCAAIWYADRIERRGAAEPAAAQADEEKEENDEIAAATLVREGDTAPDFTVEMLDGTTVTLSDLRGEVVLLNFWATWCPPCREELSRVQECLLDRFAGQPFRFLPVSRGEERAKVEEFRRQKGYAFAMGLDPDQTIYRLYASNYIPRNFLIDRDGRIVKISVGYEEEEFAELTEAVRRTLEQR